MQTRYLPETVYGHVWSDRASGGIIVGPFGVDGGWECLKKARHVGDRKFAVSDLLSVTFAPLLNDNPTPEKLVIRAKTWSPLSHGYFPSEFRRGVRFILLCLRVRPPLDWLSTAHCGSMQHNTPLAVLPMEVSTHLLACS